MKNQDIEGVFKVSDFNEDSLYANLDWLSKNQQQIEKKIFEYRYKNKKIKELFLYDVTSSYIEGNTGNTKTVTSQLKKLKETFGIERVIFVGDKGMIKSAQIDEIISDKYK